MSDDQQHQLQPGEKIMEEVIDSDGKVLYRAVHEIVEAPRRMRGAAEGASAAPVVSKIEKEEWLDPDFRALQQESAGQAPQARGLAEATESPAKSTESNEKKDDKGGDEGGGKDPVSTALAVAKFAWEFIKDNKSVVETSGAQTSILAEVNPNPLAYHSAKEGRSGAYQWRAFNWPVKEWTAWDIQVELAGTFRAQPPAGAPAGNYLPSVYFYVPHIEANWPHSASASAEVTGASNIGSATSVNPMCEVLAKLSISNFAEAKSKTFRFRAEGKAGFTKH